jgi:hypothetical protein
MAVLENAGIMNAETKREFVSKNDPSKDMAPKNHQPKFSLDINMIAQQSKYLQD